MSLTLDLIAAEIALVPVADRAAPLALGYGVDLACVMDVTPDLAEVDPLSVTAVGQAIMRRLITPRGGVLDDQNYGFDLRAYCSRGATLDELRGLAASVRGEAMKDSRVADASCSVTYTNGQLTVNLTLTLQSSDGPFALVFFVTADGIALVESIDKNG